VTVVALAIMGLEFIGHDEQTVTEMVWPEVGDAHTPPEKEGNRVGQLCETTADGEHIIVRANR